MSEIQFKMTKPLQFSEMERRSHDVAHYQYKIQVLISDFNLTISYYLSIK